MADYNFKACIDAIKTSLNSSGFRYFEGQEWPVIELGSIPKLSLDKGCTIKLDAGASRFNDIEHNRLAFIVEFVTNPQNGAYIEALPGMVAGILALKGITFTGKTTREIDERDMSILYLGSINLVSFNNIMFEIKRS